MGKVYLQMQEYDGVRGADKLIKEMGEYDGKVVKFDAVGEKNHSAVVEALKKIGSKND